MTVHVDRVARLRIYDEPVFATDASGSMGSWLDVPFAEGTCTLRTDQPMEDPGTVQQYMDAHPLEVLMPKRGGLSFEMALAGYGLASGARSQSALGALLKVCMGGEYLGTSTTVNDASATTSTIVFTSAANFRVGGVAIFTTGTGGRLEAREIKTISTNTVTLKHALSNAPSNGSTVYAGATYYLGSRIEMGDILPPTSLQALYEGLEPDDRWHFAGGQIASPPRFTLAPGTIPRIAFDWQFAQWYQADGVNTAGDFVGPELSAASYGTFAPQVLKDSELRVTTNGTSSISNTLQHATAFEFTPNISYWTHLAPGGTNNIVGYQRQHTAPAISGSFTLPYESMTFYSAMAARTRLGFFLQIGSSPTLTTGGGILLSAPSIQIKNVQRVSIDGITGQKVDWVGTIDSDVSTSTSSLNVSAFRVHLF